MTPASDTAQDPEALQLAPSYTIMAAKSTCPTLRRQVLHSGAPPRNQAPKKAWGADVRSESEGSNDKQCPVVQAVPQGDRRRCGLRYTGEDKTNEHGMEVKPRWGDTQVRVKGRTSRLKVRDEDNQRVACKVPTRRGGQRWDTVIGEAHWWNGASWTDPPLAFGDESRHTRASRNSGDWHASAAEIDVQARALELANRKLGKPKLCKIHTCRRTTPRPLRSPSAEAVQEGQPRKNNPCI